MTRLGGSVRNVAAMPPKSPPRSAGNPGSLSPTATRTPIPTRARVVGAGDDAPTVQPGDEDEEDKPTASAAAATVAAERERRAVVEDRDRDVLGLVDRFGGEAGEVRDWDDARPRMLGWAKRVAARLSQIAVDVDVTISVIAARTGSGEVVGFSRVGESDREGNVHLALRLDSHHVEVSLELDPEVKSPDRKANRAPQRVRAYDSIPLRPIVAAFQALPEQFTIGFADEQPRMGVHQVRGSKLRDLFGRGEPIWIGWSVPRELVVEHANTLHEQLADALIALGPLYKILVEHPLHPTLSPREAKEARRAKRSRRISIASPMPAPSLDAPPALDANRPPVNPPIQALRRRFLIRKTMVTEVDPKIPIEKGTSVRVLAGPFVGRTGVVQSIDGKGTARVMLGLLATQLDVKDLIATAEGAARPKLGSSHRKPLPTR